MKNPAVRFLYVEDVAKSDYQARVQDAAAAGRQGADRAHQDAEAVIEADDLREALGYWNEMIDVARHKTGELIDQSRQSNPPVPWTEIGSALGISTDAARQRWSYYKDENGRR